MDDKKIMDAAQILVGTDGIERIKAIARLLPKEHTYHKQPELLAAHLFDIGIEMVEQQVAIAVGIQNKEKEPTT